MYKIRDFLLFLVAISLVVLVVMLSYLIIDIGDRLLLKLPPKDRIIIWISLVSYAILILSVALLDWIEGRKH